MGGEATILDGDEGAADLKRQLRGIDRRILPAPSCNRRSGK
jgi:hypothetical protein